MLLSHRIEKIAPSPTLAITETAARLRAEGRDVLSLGAGEPDFDTPDHIRDAVKKAIDAGYTKYTAVDGIPELKKAIIETYLCDNGLSYAMDEVIVTCGAKQAIYNALSATLNPGDEVIIPAPYWVSYEAIVVLMEGKSVIVPCPAERNFKLTPELLEEAITPKTKWVLLNCPSNPTGAVYAKEELEELARVLKKHPHVHVLSDDIYEHIIYPPATFYSIPMVAPELKERTLLINGVSKGFSMTGWRIGYAAGPTPLIKAMKKIQSQSTSNPCSISQHGALAALNGPKDFLKKNVEIFEERRTFTVNALNDIDGLTCGMPQGAFYAYPSCEALIGSKTPSGTVIKTDTDFAAYLLEEALVAVVPGAAFGLSPHIRISYATSMDVLKEALGRIEKACANLK